MFYILNVIKSWFKSTKFREQIDPTMFKYFLNDMETISNRPCIRYTKNIFYNDIIYVFDKKCINCNISENKNINTVINNLYEQIISIKESNFNTRIIFAFNVDYKQYSNYDQFYLKFLSNNSKLFIADDIILYGLKKHKIKVLKCCDNIKIGIGYPPKYIDPHDCTISYNNKMIKEER